MKKFINVFLSALFLLSLCGCTTKHLTVEQSKKNFLVYQNSLENIVEKYNLDLSETKDLNTDNQDSYKDFVIVLDSNSDIKIRIINSAIKSEKGVKSFSIDYKIFNNKFNIDLFVDLINAVSGKEITKDFCIDFLNSPESEYSAEKKGFKKSNGEVTVKQESLNFLENWNIFYSMYENGEEILTFGGLTKQLSS